MMQPGLHAHCRQPCHYPTPHHPSSSFRHGLKASSSFLQTSRLTCIPRYDPNISSILTKNKTPIIPHVYPKGP